MRNNIILGIDPGIADTGYGVIDVSKKTPTAIDFGNIKTRAHTPLPGRLAELHEKLSALIKKYVPTIVAVEELFFHTNAKTAIVVGQARGVIILTAQLAHIPVKEYTPLEVKQSITGFGRADKKQMQKMLMLTLGLPTPPTPDDAADALAIALTAFFRRKQESLQIHL